MPTVILNPDRQSPKDIDIALRKLKKKVEAGGNLKKLHEKEFHERAGVKRNRKKSAAIMRWKRELEKSKLPEKMY
jgi:ribosomal protein S21